MSLFESYLYHIIAYKIRLTLRHCLLEKEGWCRVVLIKKCVCLRIKLTRRRCLLEKEGRCQGYHRFKCSLTCLYYLSEKNPQSIIVMMMNGGGGGWNRNPLLKCQYKFIFILGIFFLSVLLFFMFLLKSHVRGFSSLQTWWKEMIARLSQCVWTTTPERYSWSRIKTLNYASFTQLVRMVKILRCRRPEALA